MQTNVVYLIHFDRRFQHAGHYLGSAVDLEARLAQHKTGSGARLMGVVNRAGISWRCVRAWVGDRATERRLKNIGGAARLCPVCTPTNRRGKFAPDHPVTR